LFRQVDWEMPPNLEYLIERGVRLLPGGVVINEVPLTPAPAIIEDRQDPTFWSAIIGGEESAIDMASAEQEQVRQFVLDGAWTLPVAPWEQRPLRLKIAALGAALVSGQRVQSRRSRFGGQQHRSAHCGRCGADEPRSLLGDEWLVTWLRLATITLLVSTLLAFFG
jgi:hypothetical protein